MYSAEYLTFRVGIHRASANICPVYTPPSCFLREDQCTPQSMDKGRHLLPIPDPAPFVQQQKSLARRAAPAFLPETSGDLTGPVSFYALDW